MPPADAQRLLAAKNEVAPPSSLRAFLVQRYAQTCAPDATQNSGLDPSQLDSRFVNLTLSEAGDKKDDDDRPQRNPGQQ